MDQILFMHSLAGLAVIADFICFLVSGKRIKGLSSPLLVPHHLLLIMMLTRNHQWVVREMKEKGDLHLHTGRIAQSCWFIYAWIVAVAA